MRHTRREKRERNDHLRYIPLSMVYLKHGYFHKLAGIGVNKV